MSLKNHWNLFVWRCSGGSRPNWGPKGPKNFFGSLGPPLSKGLDDRPPPLISRSGYPALSCTYIILVAIILIIGQLINRFSFSVFPHALILQLRCKVNTSSCHSTFGVWEIASKDSSIFSFLKDRNDWKLSKSSILLFCLLNITCT